MAKLTPIFRHPCFFFQIPYCNDEPSSILSQTPKKGGKKQKMGLTGAGQDVWIVAKQPDGIGVRRPIVTNPPSQLRYNICQNFYPTGVFFYTETRKLK